MIDASEVIEVFRSVLDTNEALRIAMDVKYNDTKVFVRNTLPEVVIYPVILISDFILVPNIGEGQGPARYTAAIDITIFTATTASGLDDLFTLHSLFGIVDVCLRNIRGVTGTCRYNSFRLQQAQAATTVEKSSIKVITYQGTISEVV